MFAHCCLQGGLLRGVEVRCAEERRVIVRWVSAGLVQDDGDEARAVRSERSDDEAVLARGITAEAETRRGLDRIADLARALAALRDDLVDPQVLPVGLVVWVGATGTHLHAPDYREMAVREIARARTSHLVLDF